MLQKTKFSRVAQPSASRGQTWGARLTRQVNENAAMVAAVLLVNATALIGQMSWLPDALADHTPEGTSVPLALVVTAAIEAVSVYLAREAHAALMARVPSLQLRVGAYVVGFGVGYLNLMNHADADGKPTALALIYGGASVLSPLLWTIRSRRVSREVLKDAGLVDAPALRFAGVRWLHFPIRTYRAFRVAISEGITDQQEAWNREAVLREARRSGKKGSTGKHDQENGGESGKRTRKGSGTNQGKRQEEAVKVDVTDVKPTDGESQEPRALPFVPSKELEAVGDALEQLLVDVLPAPELSPRQSEIAQELLPAWLEHGTVPTLKEAAERFGASSKTVGPAISWVRGQGRVKFQRSA